MFKYKYAICNKCNWVAFCVTRKFAELEVEKKSSIKQYEMCFFCGGQYKNFRKCKNNEIPIGSTLNPIIYRNE